MLRIRLRPTGELRRMLRSCCLFVALFPAVLPAQRLLAPEDRPARAAAAKELQLLLDDTPDLPTTVALAAVAGLPLPAGSAARARLDQVLRAANTANEPERARAALRRDLGGLVEVLAFRPRMEAARPQGFPEFGVVDELELRDYPAYTMVRTTAKGGSTRAFWPLFQHIQKNDIAMTTPVQMDWQPGQDGDRRPATMAFLYGDPATRPAHVADGVEVVEVPAALVLSLGAIGNDRPAVVEAMLARLQGWLAANPAFEAAGPMRTMGYNSPMVPNDERYFEVQLPVRRRERAPAPSESRGD
ncbi:MAG: heme-binding protein [Planctomycetota bacterium]